MRYITIIERRPIAQADLWSILNTAPSFMSRLVAADGLSSCFSIEAERLVMGEERIDERETVTSCPAVFTNIHHPIWHQAEKYHKSKQRHVLEVWN